MDYFYIFKLTIENLYYFLKVHLILFGFLFLISLFNCQETMKFLISLLNSNRCNITLKTKNLKYLYILYYI